MISLSECTAAIIAGGLGTRLRTVVADRPKSMAEVAGRPFLAHVLDRLSSAGMKHTVLCIGYLGDSIRSYFGNRFGDMVLEYSAEDEPRGTGGALRLAEPLFRSETVLVMNGDSWSDVPLDAFAAFHHEKKARISITATWVDDGSRYGWVVIDGDGAVVRFEEKNPGFGGGGYINAGVYLMTRPPIRELPPGQCISLEREVFPRWIGLGMEGFLWNGRFLDIGTPESYRAAEDFFAAEPLPPDDRV
jgi:D-glycero-alpha-D-manno-heptose 1-phosphate guanylyltransferase